MRGLEAGVWAGLLDRLKIASSDRERLAVYARFLFDEHQWMWSHLPGRAFALIDGIDPGAEPLLKLLRDVLTASGPDHAAVALVRHAVSLDRTLAHLDDARRLELGTSTEVAWGPYAPLGASGHLLVLRWPRPARVPIDDQSLVARIIRNFRVLGRGPGGMAWDVGNLKEGDRDPRWTVVRALLARDEWPLRIGIWPGIDADDSSYRVEDGCAVVDPRGKRAGALLEDALQAVAWAESEEAHVLVLPELYLPAARLVDLQRELADTDREPWPALTVVGLSHTRSGAKWRNEAVALDYAGDVLWRHAKTSPFPGQDGISECLATGDTVSLRYTPAGWFAILVCLDLFAPVPRASMMAAAPNLVLGPSLSKKTTAHQNAADEARARGIACVVANRPLNGTRASAPSFHTCGSGSVLVAQPTVVSWEPPSSPSNVVQV